MTDPALFNRLNDVTGRLTELSTQLNELTTRLNSGEGTAGQLLKDKQLYENMNGAVSEIRALIDGDQEGSEAVSEREGQHLLDEGRGRRAGQSDDGAEAHGKR